MPSKRLSPNNHGFTIVELLIVIVVIAILAAITIVAFNGVTARANTASAQSAASTVAKKAEAYYTEHSSYPTSSEVFTDSANTNQPWYVSDITFDLSDEQPTKPNSLDYATCGSPATGATTYYWNYVTQDYESIQAGSCPSSGSTGEV